MSTPAQALPGAGTPAAAVPPLTAIELIEQELANFFRQREQAIANVHAVDGAIQSTQHLLAKLKAEVVKGEAWVKAEAERVEAEAKKLAGEAETEVSKGIHVVEAEAKKL
jgi:nucleotide-binding universal stress UspA family protein